jgi:2-keto-4-pentenoate hydratase/2-oxohepta-3-ene-1,7-dioic acid hydratase in catechol pathway
MQLVSFEAGGTQSFGVLRGDRIVDVGSAGLPGCTSVRTTLAKQALPDVARYADEHDAEISLSDVTLLPPVTDSAKIFCVGLNYREHAAESEAVSAGVDSPNPTIFCRYPDSQVGHGSGIIKPGVSEQFDYEGELAVIIGRPAFRISVDDAPGVVAGYAPYNEGSARDWQLKSSQWLAGKSFYRSAGFGPALVTVDEVPDLDDQVLTTRVNGEVRQRANIADLIHTIPEIISFISQFTPLSPGDVIVSGTPSGAGLFRDPPEFLQVGDVVEVEVTGVGLLRNTVITDPVVSAKTY